MQTSHLDKIWRPNKRTNSSTMNRPETDCGKVGLSTAYPQHSRHQGLVMDHRKGIELLLREEVLEHKRPQTTECERSQGGTWSGKGLELEGERKLCNMDTRKGQAAAIEGKMGGKRAKQRRGKLTDGCCKTNIPTGGGHPKQRILKYRLIHAHSLRSRLHSHRSCFNYPYS